VRRRTSSILRLAADISAVSKSLEGTGGGENEGVSSRQVTFGGFTTECKQQSRRLIQKKGGAVRGQPCQRTALAEGGEPNHQKCEMDNNMANTLFGFRGGKKMLRKSRKGSYPHGHGGSLREK